MNKLILYIIVFFGFFNLAQADVLKNDTAKVELRSFDNDKIEKARNNPRYNYKTKESWLKATWNRFLEWLERTYGKKIKDAASQSGSSNVLNVIIAIAAIALLIFGISKVKFRSWISGKGAVIEQKYDVEDENIHEIEFDKDIRDAEHAGDYRRAIRLQFLKVLKNLSDAELIYWDPNKTNHQYLFELNGTKAYAPFIKCVHIFDVVWYGEWKIDHSYYLINKPTFDELAKGSIKPKTKVYNG